ncbi:MAG TPA: class I SAM-dependent methyltransferase [Chthoniobacteraceae bacterium]|jgi:SAM-dependent methyltransferase
MKTPTLLLTSLLALVASTLAQTTAAPIAPAIPAEMPERKPDIHYVPTPEDVVEEMLRLTNVTKDDLVYDLGSGDGRIVITAAKKRGARGIGIDIDPQRITEAKENAKKAGVEDRVKFMKADIFKSDFKDATVVTLYLLTSINEKLRPKLFAELKPGTRIASHAFSMGDWKADEHKILGSRSVFYWVLPANLSGRWKIAGKAEGGVTSLDLQQKFQMLTGAAEVQGEQRAITDGRVTGESFTVTLAPAKEGGEPIKFSGRLSGEKLQSSGEGKQPATWSAEREEGTKQQLQARL